MRPCHGADSDWKKAELTYAILAQLIGWDDEVDYSWLFFLETAEIFLAGRTEVDMARIEDCGWCKWLLLKQEVIDAFDMVDEAMILVLDANGDGGKTNMTLLS